MATVQEYQITTFDDILGGALGRADADAARKWMSGNHHIETFPTDNSWVKKVRIRDTRVYSVEEEEQGQEQEDGDGDVVSPGPAPVLEQQASPGQQQKSFKNLKEDDVRERKVVQIKLDHDSSPSNNQVHTVPHRSEDVQHQVQQAATNRPVSPDDARAMKKSETRGASNKKRSVTQQQEYWKGIKLLVDEIEPGAMNQTYYLSRDGIVAGSDEFKKIIDKKLEAFKRSDTKYWKEKMKSAVCFVRKIASRPLKYFAKAGAMDDNLAKHMIVLQRRKFALADDSSPVRYPYKELQGLEDLEEQVRSPDGKALKEPLGGEPQAGCLSVDGNQAQAQNKSAQTPRHVTGRKRPRKSLKPLHATAALQ